MSADNGRPPIAGPVAVQERSAQRESCGNCRFYAALKSLCRKNPPTLVTAVITDPLGRQSVEAQGVFTPVGQGDWCGSWQDEARG